MSINLFGDPANLQGGSSSLQGGYNPQQATGLYGPPSPAPVATAPNPTAQTTRKAAPRLVSSRPAAVQVAQPDSQINSIFENHIGSRPSASNPGVLEYYNKDTGQGFSNEQ